MTSTRTHCLCIVMAMSFSGCAGPAPPADVTGLARPPAAWMEAPRALPPIPKCDRDKSPIACRASYDAAERKQHGDVASKLARLQGWVNSLLSQH